MRQHQTRKKQNLPALWAGVVRAVRSALSQMANVTLGGVVTYMWQGLTFNFLCDSAWMFWVSTSATVRFVWWALVAAYYWFVRYLDAFFPYIFLQCAGYC